MKINEDDGDWVVIGMEPGKRQRVPPRWPDPDHPQQLHLDIRVSDMDEAEPAVLALGATRVHDESRSGFRVFLDPVGHPFCLLYPRRAA